MRLKNIPFVVSVVILVLWAGCSTKQNKYNLDILSDVREYHQKTTQDPANQLIDLEKFVPGIELDIRYAGTNNFTGEQIYLSPKAFVRKPVAEAVFKVQQDLKKNGLGLKVFDAYRPYAATVRFYEVYPDTIFVAAPWKGSVHNRACAIDVTLIDLQTKQELQMPTMFDDFTEKASQKYMDLPEDALKNRSLLCDVMTRHGFEILEAEWWHYNFKGWKNYQLMDISFEELEGK